MFTAQGSTVIAAVLAIVAGAQVAVLADPGPYDQGWIYGSQCNTAPDPLACVREKCSIYSGSADQCAFAACYNGAADWHNSHYDPGTFAVAHMECIRKAPTTAP